MGLDIVIPAQEEADNELLLQEEILPGPRLIERTKAESISASRVASASTEASVAAARPSSKQTQVFDLQIDSMNRLSGSRRPKVPFATRAFEITVASLALALTLPLMLALGLIVKAGTRGPVLFRQKRMGIGCKPFNFFKFRTMHADARERFPELYAYKYGEQDLEDLKFKVESDPRMTPQGEWLRKTSLDELPNFWNVITGDMALVGPRPEIPEMLPYYQGDMLQKFSVRPGVTGLAQVSGRGRLGFYETVELDLECVRNQSFLYDLKIILRTINQVIMGDGAF